MSFAERRKLARALFPETTMSDDEALELPDSHLVDGAFEVSIRLGLDVRVQVVCKGFSLRAMRLWSEPRRRHEGEDTGADNCQDDEEARNCKDADDADTQGFQFPQRRFHAAYRLFWGEIGALEDGCTLEQACRQKSEISWDEYEIQRASWSSDLCMRGYNPQLFDSRLAQTYTPIDPELSSCFVQRVLKNLAQQEDYLHGHDLSRFVVAGVFADGQPKILEVIV